MGILKHFVKNIKLNINDVHIRYQDVTTIPNHSFVFGITIKKILVQNKDDRNKQNEDEQDDDEEERNYLNRTASNFLDNYLMEMIDSSSSSDDDNEYRQDQKVENVKDDKEGQTEKEKEKEKETE